MQFHLNGFSGHGVSPGEVQDYFVRSGRYTAGTATRYAPSMLISASAHQQLAPGFIMGTRFHSAPIIRLADAKPMHLGHLVKADGRWRLLAFANRDEPASPESRIWKLCDFLASSPRSPVVRHTAPGDDIDSALDVRAIFQQPHRALAVGEMHALLSPQKGRLGLRDYEKIFCADHRSGQDLFDTRGIDRDCGCIVLVRPDQFVAHILPIDAYDELTSFFAAFMSPADSDMVDDAGTLRAPSWPPPTR